MAGRTDDRRYITWEDVAVMAQDLEEEYGIVVRFTGTPVAGTRAGTLYWRATAHGRAGGDVESIAWVGGTMREWNAATVPGLFVGLLTSLSATIEGQLQWAQQPIELQIGA